MVPLAHLEELALRLRQLIRVFIRPSLRLLPRIPAQTQRIGSALIIPHRRLMLEHAQVPLPPRRIVRADRLHQTIMRQLQPRHPAPLLTADEMHIHQLLNRRLAHLPAVLRTHHHLTAKATLRDQPTVKPLAQHPLFHATFPRDLRRSLRVIIRQRRIHIARPNHLRLRDLLHTLRQLFPKPVTHHLQLYRLNIRPELYLGRTRRRLHRDLAQVVHQLRRRPFRELDTAFFRGTLHRDPRRIRVQQIEPKRGFQPRGNRPQIRIERRHMILAHRKKRPPFQIAQRLTDLIEEVHLRLPIHRIDRQDFLELIEDEKRPIARILPRLATLQIFAQRHRRQLCHRDRIFRPHALFQRKQRTHHIRIARRHFLCRPTPDPNHRQHMKLLRLQFRNQRRLNQRSLPRTRRRIKQHDSLSNQQFEELACLAIPAINVLAIPQ